MSQENVERLLRLIDAYNRRDLDAALENWAPDAVLDWSSSRGFDGAVYRGRSEIRAFMQGLLEVWAEIRIELSAEPVDLGDGRLLAPNVTHFRGRDGIEVQARSAWLVTFQNGLLASLTLYQSKQEALQAAGMSE